MAKEFSIVMHYRLPLAASGLSGPVCRLCRRDGVLHFTPSMAWAGAVPAVHLSARGGDRRRPGGLAGCLAQPGVPAGQAGFAGLTLLAALGGAGVAAWHVKLQLFTPADKIPACGPGLDHAGNHAVYRYAG